MSIAVVRGGIPIPYRGALTTAVERIDFGRHMHLIAEFEDRTNLGVANYLTIQNHDLTNDIRVYFHQGHADNDEHYIIIHADSATAGYGTWSGPMEGRSIWIRADSGTVTAFDAVAFLRRG